ncbi:MAG: hypothetical protein ACYTG7_24045, partial [Planctomycetota bacterium]
PTPSQAVLIDDFSIDDVSLNPAITGCSLREIPAIAYALTNEEPEADRMVHDWCMIEVGS